MDFIIECKITQGMELFEQQCFKEQYIILTITEEGHEKVYTNLNFSLQNSCTPSLYIHIFQDEKCRLMRNLSLSMALFHSNRK